LRVNREFAAFSHQKEIETALGILKLGEFLQNPFVQLYQPNEIFRKPRKRLGH